MNSTMTNHWSLTLPSMSVLATIPDLLDPPCYSQSSLNATNRFEYCFYRNYAVEFCTQQSNHLHPTILSSSKFGGAHPSTINGIEWYPRNLKIKVEWNRRRRTRGKRLVGPASNSQGPEARGIGSRLSPYKLSIWILNCTEVIYNDVEGHASGLG